MTFFEKEMRKLFQHGLSFQETIFAGRACYGKLDEDIRVRMEFATEGVADHYSALKVTLLNRKEGPNDSLVLRFSEVLGRKQTTNPNFREGMFPHIWKDGNDFAWYVYQPTAADYKTLADAVGSYTSMFQGEDLTQGMDSMTL
ncbi:hypothetical protein D3Z55_24080 [Clostridiaceae bacterium]|nr:hypothetical protein [Clostridiaceae bacterium]